MISKHQVGILRKIQEVSIIIISDIIMKKKSLSGYFCFEKAMKQSLPMYILAITKALRG